MIHSPAFRRLQGKTQLFPGIESDFFRNRLTHSLEVGQIAESIAFKINAEHDYFCGHEIIPRIPMLAGLAHDLGHPPFGHNGEKALDDCMKGTGGFEGNAQTFRILSTLEKKQLRGGDLDWAVGVDDKGNDYRAGLNLTHRVMASILKYDAEIPVVREEGAKLAKGYYASDAPYVRAIKRAICRDPNRAQFRTIECCIMDIADDIAYSTYDVEDALKGGFMSPLDMISASGELLNAVCDTVGERLDRAVTIDDVQGALLDLFRRAIITDEMVEQFLEDRQTGDTDEKDAERSVLFSTKTYTMSKALSDIGYLRTSLTSDLVARFIQGVRVDLNEECPALSKVYLDEETALLVESLKVFTYEATIMSPRLKVVEAKGYDIVRGIFDKLAGADGRNLLPDDTRTLFDRCAGEQQRKRVICDFVAGMTDRYATEFYSRLTGETHRTIFRPI